MNTARQLPVYRMPRSAGIALLSDLWRFAAWLAKHLPHDVRVEGVTFVRTSENSTTFAAPKLTANAPGDGSNKTLAVPVPPYRFDRRKGVALFEDMTRYARHITLHLLPPLLASRDLASLGASLQPESLRLRKPTGIVLLDDLAAFIQNVAHIVGFQLARADFIATRDTGLGLHIRRKRHSVITLTLEAQARWCIAKYCIFEEDAAVVYTAKTIVTTYANGAVTETNTQPDPGPHYETPAAADHTCDTADFTTDYDPGFDYGAFVSETTTFSGAVYATGLLALALANVANDGPPVEAGSWTWIEGDPQPAFGNLNLGSWSDGGLPLTTRRVDSYQYRWLVSGGDLDVRWTQGGADLSTTVNDGTTSAWYEDEVITLAINTDDQITNLRIMEV